MTDDKAQAGAAGESGKTVAVRTEPAAPAIFNPLDAEPLAFKQQLVNRSENYDALASHLRAQLAPHKDFGRIHIAPKSKCNKPWQCTPEKEPYHWSPWALFAPGADKVLGILGLGVTYPDEQDYRRASLKGIRIEDVVLKAFITTANETVICEGMGAASREQENGDLNRTIKKAEKRARMDAVMRLPAISALFEDDFLAQVASGARDNNSTSSRLRKVDPRYDTGAILRVWPFDNPQELAGVAFTDMKDTTLEWIVRKLADKPDIQAAAERELERRQAPHTPQATTDQGATAARDPDGGGRERSEDVAPASRHGHAGGSGRGTEDFLAEWDRQAAIEAAAEAAKEIDT